MPFSMADILAGYGGSPDPENPSSGQITPGLLLRAIAAADEQASKAVGQAAGGALSLGKYPGDVTQGNVPYLPPGLRREDFTDIPPDQTPADNLVGRFTGVAPRAYEPLDPQIQKTVDLGANLMGVGTGFAQPGSAGIFGGRLARNAPLDKYAKADELLAKGAKREQIYKETGLTLGKDLQLRHEIDDYGMRFTPLGEEAIANRTAGLRADQVIDHPELWKAYPDAAGYKVSFTDPIPGSNSFGGIDKANKTLYLNPAAFEPEFLARYNITPEQVRRGVVPGLEGLRSTALHELQHMVQEAEGHAAGGNILLPEVQKAADKAIAKQKLEYENEYANINGQRQAYIREQQMAGRDGTPESWNREWAQQNPLLFNRAAELKYRVHQANSQYNKSVALQEAYQGLAGETESRNTQLRRDMTAEERAATPAWKTQDVPYAQQLLRFTDPYGNTISGAEAALRRATRQDNLRPGVLGQQVPSQGAFEFSSEVPSFSERMAGLRDVAFAGRQRGTGNILPRSTANEPPLLAPGETRGDLAGALTPGLPPAETSIADVGRNAYRDTLATPQPPASISDIGQRSYRERLGLGPNLELQGERLAPEDVAGPAMGIGAPYIRNPNAPLFDLRRLAERPDVPQFDLPRITPVRGVPEDILKLATPENIARVNAIVRSGLKKGGIEWYNTLPYKEAAMEELGMTPGARQYIDYLKAVGATSPRSTVPSNIAKASYYDYLLRNEQPLPRLIQKPGGEWSVPPGQIPEGYGSIAQAHHVRNMMALRDAGELPVLQNPKPPSFTENLLGNYRPVTSDVHNLSLWGSTREKPGPGYQFLEQLQQKQAKRMGIEPAQYQAGGWIDYGQSGGKSFMQLLEDQIAATAEAQGLTKQQALREWLRGHMPLVP